MVADARRKSFAIIQQGIKNFSLMKTKLKEMELQPQPGMITEDSKRFSFALQKQNQEVGLN